MIRSGLSLALLAAALAAAGCGGGVKEEVIEVKESNDPLAEPRAVLKRYAAGQPMTSEVSAFPNMVEQVRKTDPARADVLEKGFADLQKSAPASRPGKARELLAKLQPSMKGPEQ